MRGRGAREGAEDASPSRLPLWLAAVRRTASLPLHLPCRVPPSPLIMDCTPNGGKINLFPLYFRHFVTTIPIVLEGQWLDLDKG